MFCNIITTTNKKKILEEVSKELLSKGYSSCIQITGPLESRYFWDGVIKTTKEYKLTIKTLDALAEKVVILIKSIHNYEVPEIIKQPIVIENKDYEKWMLTNIKK